MRKLYFDYNATTPVHPRVFDSMRPYLQENFGNPGSAHGWGLDAKKAVDAARERVAALIGAEPAEIVFTSGATEADNLALMGTLPYMDRKGMIISAVEHPAITEPAGVLKKRGHPVSVASVDEHGVALAGEVRGLIGDETGLVSVMLANNETGAIQPVGEIARQAVVHGALMHTDAAQAVGKIQVKVNELGVDLLSVAGHKMYAPKGVGALFIRCGTPVQPLVHGGGQERGIRPGTENVPYIVGLGEACAMADEDLQEEESRQRGLGEIFIRGLLDTGIDHRVNSLQAPRLPGTLSVSFRNLKSGDILSGLLAAEVGASGGAACHAGKTKISGVLAAMEVPREYAEGTIRFSWGRMTTEEDMRELIVRLRTIIESFSV